MSAPRKQTLAFALAPVLAAGGLALMWLTAGALGGSYLYFPLTMVFVTALYGGLGPGLLTLVLSAAGTDYFFLGPPHAFGVATVDEAHRLASFVVAGLAATWVSARYRAERLAAEHAREEAKRVGALQERLVAVVSHDLRNPLASLRVGLDVLPRLGALDRRQRAVVARMHGSAMRMERLIEDLLGVARSRRGELFPVALAPARLGDICARAVSELREAFPDQPIRLAVDGDDEGLLDARRLEQVASNLVSNALKHGSPRDPVEVRVRGLADELVLEVRNRGAPIPQELLPDLFQPFRSGGGSGDGVGLGLFVVEQIATAHGGSVRVQSDRTATAFEVHLPRRSPGATRGSATGAHA